MGSLGDKFKKLAGDQTRQLLQNFQNAQSSKTRNGYSYGKLNEDGTATLADGTVVQVEVKGRPGQYAPVFNLGNGQGLVDQPEAKFFTVDGSSDNPFVVVVGWTRTFSEESRTIAITGVWVVDRLGNKYALPSEFWPDPPSLPYYSSPQFAITCCAGSGGFAILAYCTNYTDYTKDNIDSPPPQFPPASLLVVESFTAGDGMITPNKDSYVKKSIDYNAYLEVATTQNTNLFPGVGFYSSSPECTSLEITSTLDGTITNPFGQATYTAYLKLLNRINIDRSLLVDLAVSGETTFRRGYFSVNTAYTWTVGGQVGPVEVVTRQGVYEIIDNPFPNSESKYQISLLYTNWTNSGGGGSSGTDHQDPGYQMSVPVFDGVIQCNQKTPRGPTLGAYGGILYSKVIKDLLSAQEIFTIDEKEFDPNSISNPSPVDTVVAAIPTKDPEVFTSIVSNQGLQFIEDFEVSLRRGYSSNVLYSSPIQRSTSNYYYDITPYPVGYNDGVILYGTGGGDDRITAPLYSNKAGFSLTSPEFFPGFSGATYLTYLAYPLQDSILTGRRIFYFYNISTVDQEYTINKTYNSGVSVWDLIPLGEDPVQSRFTYAFGYR